MSDVAIRVENLSKLYHIGAAQKRHDTMRDALVDGLRAPVESLSSFVRRPSPIGDERRRTNGESVWALKDVSFEVRRGEVVGIIGRNGAGKSTLLKILSRITEPTKGRAIIDGRVGSLLEVGTGFHPELTGRENTYLNGAILGMKRAEIDRRFDEIVAFAEIEKFLDTPVKHYSSGMYVRLAFAVAAHLEPEILLVDEVLAVGDAGFQKKCLGKMGDAAKEGRTVLFVSHNMAAIQSLSHRCNLFENGRLALEGDPESVLFKYSCATDSRGACEDLTKASGREKRSIAILERVRLLDENGIETTTFRTGQKVVVRLTVAPRESLKRPVLGIGVNTALGQRVFTAASYHSRIPLLGIEGRSQVDCIIPELPLAPGTYSLDLSAGNGMEGLIDHVRSAIWFDVATADYFGTGVVPSSTQGHVVIKTGWRLAPDTSGGDSEDLEC